MNGPASLFEWDIPVSLVLDDVSGPDVHTWSRTGSRLQVWFTHSLTETTIRLAGWLPRPTETVRFDVPLIHPRNADTAGTLRIAASEGLSLNPVSTTNLVETARPAAGGHEAHYTYGSQPYKAAFQVRVAAGTTDFRLHTDVAQREQKVFATTTIDAHIRRGELRSFTVLARNASGWTTHLSAPEKRARSRKDHADR